MAKKAKSSGKSSGPAWRPGYITVGFLLVLGLSIGLGFFGKVDVPKDPDDEPVVDTTPAPPRKTLKELETQVTNLHTALMSISGRGETGAFAKIRGMADAAKKVLDAAKAKGVTPQEKRRILEEGLAQKADWLSSLHDSTAAIQEEQEKENVENAPISTEGVVPLTTDAFSDFIASNHHTMVEFYAPWCPHCKKFAPEYRKAAEHFDGRVAFAIVDGSAETMLTRVYDIKGYPTLKWFVQGRPFNCEASGVAEKVIDWVEDRLQPAYMDVELKSDLEEALKQGAGEGKVWLLGGEGPKASLEFKHFLHAAEHFRGKLVFGWAPSESETSFTLYMGSPDAKDIPGEDDFKNADNLIGWLSTRVGSGGQAADTV